MKEAPAKKGRKRKEWPPLTDVFGYVVQIDNGDNGIIVWDLTQLEHPTRVLGLHLRAVDAARVARGWPRTARVVKVRLVPVDDKP